MINWQQLVSPLFWFSIGWNPLSFSAALTMAGFFAVLAAVGLILPRAATGKRHVPKFERAAWRGVGRPAIVCGLLGLLFTFFAYEQVAFFSGRFWFLGIALGFVVSEAFACRTLFLEMPHMKEEQDEREARQKYLPTQKN